MWLNGLLYEIEHRKFYPVMHMDSHSALCWCKDPIYHERSNHLDVRLHFIRDLEEFKEIEVVKISGSTNPTDFGTKIVLASIFCFLCR